MAIAAGQAGAVLPPTMVSVAALVSPHSQMKSGARPGCGLDDRLDGMWSRMDRAMLSRMLRF
jgi:hypothetical protein